MLVCRSILCVVSSPQLSNTNSVQYIYKIHKGRRKEKRHCHSLEIALQYFGIFISNILMNILILCSYGYIIYNFIIWPISVFIIT